MAVDQTRFFITTRDNIDTNINNGTINANDFVICSDTHELIYVDNNNNYFAITTTGEGMDELVQQLEERLTEIQEAAENSIVTGVKGSNEQTYRTGNVNIGTDDFGLGNVTNHTQVRGLITGTTEDHLVSWGNSGYVVKDSGVTAVNGELIANNLTLNSSTPNSIKTFTVAVDDNGDIYTISGNGQINKVSGASRLSELINDSNFVTTTDMNSAISTATTSLSNSINNLESQMQSIGGSNENVLTRIQDDPTQNGGIIECAATSAAGMSSHAEGTGTVAEGLNSHAEGNGTRAYGSNSHAEGEYSVAGIINDVTAKNSHAEGYHTIASGEAAHSEGSAWIDEEHNNEEYPTEASGKGSHAEGIMTTASGEASHSEGFATMAEGDYSHSQGMDSAAAGNCSFASGLGVYADADNQTVVGMYNVPSSNYAFIVGNGTDVMNRSDAFAVMWDGTLVIGGSVVITPADFNTIITTVIGREDSV